MSTSIRSEQGISKTPESQGSARGSKPRRRRSTPGAARRRRNLEGWLLLAPALIAYAVFVLWPLLMGINYSFFSWNGIGAAKWVGLSNFTRVLTDPELLGAIGNALMLVLYFTIIPVGVGLILATLIKSIKSGAFASISQTILFLPQIIPLAAAGIAWSWMYAKTGTVNQLLSAIGLEGITRPWLGDFTTALPAVGLIGSWVLTGLCTVLFLTGIGKIDQSLYESVRLDGAGWWREFFTITLPGLRQEIAVLTTITMIAALRSFDVIYLTTQGGPGRSTLVPGISIYRIGITQSNVGLASAFGIVLMVLVIVVVLPIQRLSKESDS